MGKLRNTVAALAAMALSAGLATSVVAQDEAETMDLDTPEGVTWILEQQAVNGPEALEHLPKLVLASLYMEDGQAGGDSGCNSWFGSYELDGEALTFGMTGATQMACPGPMMAVEQAFLTNIAAVASWASDGASLTLSDADGNAIMYFLAAPEATVVGSWVATGINNQLGENAGVVSSATTSEVTADFSPAGELTGFDGCNNYFTSYEVDGDAIAIDPAIGQTRMACPSDELAEQSQWYIDALTNATTWSVDAAGNLALRDADGALQVSYAPAG